MWMMVSLCSQPAVSFPDYKWSVRKYLMQQAIRAAFNASRAEFMAQQRDKWQRAVEPLLAFFRTADAELRAEIETKETADRNRALAIAQVCSNKLRDKCSVMIHSLIRLVAMLACCGCSTTTA